MYLTQSWGAFDFHELPRLTAAPQHAKLHEAHPLSELGVNVVIWSVKKPLLHFHVVARYLSLGNKQHVMITQSRAVLALWCSFGIKHQLSNALSTPRLTPIVILFNFLLLLLLLLNFRLLRRHTFTRTHTCGTHALADQRPALRWLRCRRCFLNKPFR